MSHRQMMKLVPTVAFFPLFVATSALFFWVFALVRSYAFASSFDSMSVLFEANNADVSEIAWADFQATWQLGISSMIGFAGLLGCCIVGAYIFVRYRAFALAVATAEESPAYRNEANLMKLPTGFWQDTYVRMLIGAVLIAISFVVGMAERNRDAFELAQTDLIYPDVQWYSNIEFTIGVIGCFVLSSFVFLWSRIQVAVFDAEELYDAQSATPSDGLEQWEAAIKR